MKINATEKGADESAPLTFICLKENYFTSRNRPKAFSRA